MNRRSHKKHAPRPTMAAALVRLAEVIEKCSPQTGARALAWEPVPAATPFERRHPDTCRLRRTRDRSLRSESLLRALLTSQHRLEPVIKLAIRHYVDTKHDLANIERLVVLLKLEWVERTADCDDRVLMLEDLVTRAKRQVHLRLCTLKDLTVEVHEVPRGDLPDLDVHRIVGTQPTTELELDGRIADVKHDLFTWRYEGQPQMVEGQVIVFACDPAKSPCPSESNQPDSPAVLSGSEGDSR